MDHVNDEYNIIYILLGTVTLTSLARYSYCTVPGFFPFLGSPSMGASGILTTFAAPALGNMGRGTPIGIVNTSIDYTNSSSHYPDGSARIAGLWDQSIPMEADIILPGVPAYYELSGASYGTEFTREQINTVLASESPSDLVPSTDTNGHGTSLAGITTGSFLPEQDFTGVAPECESIMVKLEQAKYYLWEFYLVNEGADAYRENNIMVGIKYLRATALRLGRSLIVLIALGSNLGSHKGTSPPSSAVQDASRFLGRVAIIVAGNETGQAHHYFGTIPVGQERDDVEVQVGLEEPSRGFTLELWVSTADTYSVGFISPSGEIISCIPIIARSEVPIPSLLEPTVITVNHQLIGSGVGKQLIFMRFKDPATGIWRVRVYSTQYFTGEFNIWLPSEGPISDETAFLRLIPDTTITMPSNVGMSVTVRAHNRLSNSIYVHSSRGLTPSGIIKPELAAPGVGVMGPAVGRRINSSIPMTTCSGTSVAVTHVADAVASLFDWGIVEGSQITMSQASVKSYLIYGAKRSPALRYPNKEWGCGALDSHKTFRRIKK